MDNISDPLVREAVKLLAFRKLRDALRLVQNQSYETYTDESPSQKVVAVYPGDFKALMVAFGDAEIAMGGQS